MFLSQNESELLEQIAYPAFLVSDGKITAANSKAKQKHIETDTDIALLLHSGRQEYAEFTQGRLCLTVLAADIIYNASVTKLNGLDLFCIESECIDPELRALAVAAQYLREPLSNAFLSAEALKDSVTDAVYQSLNRNLHRLLRAVCNMSDVATYSNKRHAKIENCNVTAEIGETILKAKESLTKAGCDLQYEHPGRSFTCLIDKEKLERAILNLISNAIQYGCKGSTVKLKLTHTKDRFCISVSNQINGKEALSAAQMFHYYQREPGLFDANNGIGIGMTIARNAATAHGGTLLFDTPTDETVRFTLSIPINRSKKLSLHAPILFPIDYSGGYDHLLTELSEILPDEFFE